MNVNDFDWKTYLENYEDLRKAGIITKEKAYLHWIIYGRKEGRTDKKKVKVIQPAPVHIYKFSELPLIIKNYVVHNKLQDRVFYTGKVPFDVYNEIISACDIGIQIRPGNGGGLSGSVVDCLSLDVPIITGKDIVDSLDIDHPMLMGLDLTKYNDWIPILHDYNYSDSLTKDISSLLLQFIDNKKRGVSIINNNNKISDIVNSRFENYAKLFIDTLSLKPIDKIAFVTPYPPDFCGIADFTSSTIDKLSQYVAHIDIFTDANVEGNNFYHIDDIVHKFKDYSNVIFVVGNSNFHTKVIMYLKNLGGACILHDEHLYHLYKYLGKIQNNSIIDYNKEIPRCFDEIIHSDPLIVHSKKLQNIIKNVYNKDTKYIPFCSFNKLRKFENDELRRIKAKYRIDGDINVIVNGRFKYPFHVLKISQFLQKYNVKCKIFFVGS